MGIKFANSAFATLASGINNSATSITLTTGQGARFPSLSAGDYFFATLIDTSNNLEIVKCTARSTDVLTVTRAQESTTARAFSTGDRIELRITAQGIADSAGNLASGTLVIPGTSASGAIARLYEDTDNGTHYVGLKAAASIASSFDFTLPSTDGTAHQILKTDGAGNLAFANADKSILPTGSILQVVQTTKTDTFSTTSASLVDITGLSASITPRSSSNKVLVLVDLHIGYSTYAGIVHLLRGSTKIYAGDGGISRCGLYSNAYSNSPEYTLIPVTAVCLDSPATTSSTTYKLQMATYSSGTQYVNRTHTDIAESTRDGRTVSSITLIEVAA